MPRLAAMLLLAACFAGVDRSSAAERRYQLRTGDAETEVRFHSKATLEDFEGHGDQLSGWFSFDPEDLKSLRGEFEFDLRCLDTGLGLRNKHMRDTVLHTDDHPMARFVVSGCPAGKLTAGAIQAEVEGTLSLHGVSKKATARVTATPEGDAVRIHADFRVKLSDFEIKRPKMLVMKVAEEVDLVIRALALPAGATTDTDASSEKEDSR
jgi:polyisoprenoid-binding protein YceI